MPSSGFYPDYRRSSDMQKNSMTSKRLRPFDDVYPAPVKPHPVSALGDQWRLAAALRRQTHGMTNTQVFSWYFAKTPHAHTSQHKLYLWERHMICILSRLLGAMVSRAVSATIALPIASFLFIWQHFDTPIFSNAQRVGTWASLSRVRTQCHTSSLSSLSFVVSNYSSYTSSMKQ